LADWWPGWEGGERGEAKLKEEGKDEFGVEELE